METNADINKPVPVLLPTRDWSALRAEALATRTSASAIIRALVAAHLRKRARAKSKPAA